MSDKLALIINDYPYLYTAFIYCVGILTGFLAALGLSFILMMKRIIKDRGFY